MSLRSKTQNRRGGNPLWKENLGYVAAFKDNRTSIILDGYEGFGNEYRERAEPLITIENKGILIFTGTFDELEAKLKLGIPSD